MTLRTRILVAAVAATVTATGVVATSAADARPSPSAAAASLALTGGHTSVHLAPATASALTKAGYAIRPTSEARATKDGVRFPVTGGLLDAKTAAGFISHSGGLVITHKGKRLTVRDFRVSTTHTGLSAYADQAGARIRLFKLGLGNATVAVKHHRLHVKHVGLLLSKPAAKALNGYFHTHLFARGIKVGTARVNAGVRTLH